MLRQWLLVIVLVGFGSACVDHAEAERGAKRRENALTAAKVLSAQTVLYRAEHAGSCPLAEQLGKFSVDPWGMPFKISCRPGRDFGDNTVLSFGPDKIEGTSDDIVDLPAGH